MQDLIYMIIKIFFEDKSVFLCDEITNVIKEIIKDQDVIFINVASTSTSAIKSLLKKIEKPEFKAAVLLDTNIKKLKKAFFGHFTIIKAAGGLVKNEQNEILFIFRRGKWDLPKGKNDDGEIPIECAVREVKEETGLLNVEAGNHLCTTYHTYYESGKNILKETEWFAMKASSEQELTPQQDEGIEKIEWVNKQDKSEKLKNSFPLIADVINSSLISVEN